MTIPQDLLDKLFEEAKGTFGSRFFAEQSGKAERMINGSRL